VDEVERLPSPLQVEGERVGKGMVVVAEDDDELRRERAEFVENALVADIAEMPDLVDTLEKFGEAGMNASVGIGDKGDGMSRDRHGRNLTILSAIDKRRRRPMIFR
jgi:hypothetical protein